MSDNGVIDKSEFRERVVKGHRRIAEYYELGDYERVPQFARAMQEFENAEDAGDRETAIGWLQEAFKRLKRVRT